MIDVSSFNEEAFFISDKISCIYNYIKVRAQ